MSKNFELLQQAGMNLELPAVPEPKSILSGAGVGKQVRSATHQNLEKVGRDESLRLVQRVFLLDGKASPRVVVFAGIDAGNGCSQICARSAEILANSVPGSVCIVDGNFISPSLPEYFGVTNHHGLTDALRGDGSIREYAKQIRLQNLWLLSSGSLPADSGSLLNSVRTKARLDELRKEFDYVLIDSPPLGAYVDAVALGQLCDGLVLVLEANSTRRKATTSVMETLRATQVRVLGAVLNKRTFPIPAALYHKL